MQMLPTPYPPTWMDVTVSERRQQAHAAAEQARRVAQLGVPRWGHRSIRGALLQTVGAGLIRLGTRLQGTRPPHGRLGSVGTAR